MPVLTATSWKGLPPAGEHERDIEDDAEICGDVDVENFPTLAVWRGGALLFYGVSLPQEPTAARLVDALAAGGQTVLDAPAEVLKLGRTLAR